MADSDKNILITPSTGLTTQPTIEFTGFDNNKLTLTVLDDGTLSISGSSGQLFSIADSLVGTIFSVNDISGIPSIEVDDDGTIRFAEFAGNVLIGTATDNGTDKLQVNGSISATSFTGTVDWSNLSNLPDPTITLTGAVTGTATMTNLGNVSIATTATADPTLTIDGDASGSATFTNLGNATLTLTISDDSHNHTISNIDNLQTALDGKLATSGGTLSGDLQIGDGSAQTRLLIQKADNDTADHIIFYSGTTRIGEIGALDTTWLRLNQETNKNIYTPRYIRADAGFFVDGTSKGIDGSGNLIGMGTGSFSDQITSTVAAGTAPFIVASDTVVANLNADKVDGYDASRIFLTSLDTINSSAQDFNSFTTSGSYYVTNWSEAGDEVANGPTGSYAWGCLKVTQFNGPTYVLQEYWPHNTDISWSRVNWAGTWTAWRESWGSGNDGSGSGLDADLLDGQQGSYYLNYNNFTNTPTIYAEPGIFSGGGTPTLASGVTGAEIRTLIGAGTSSTTGTVTSVEVAAGNALTGGGTVTSSGTITINHEDTSTQASVDNSDGNVIQDVTLDTYGHVTGLASVDLDGRYALKQNAAITGSAATGLTVTAAADNLGVVIKRDFDSADEPAALLIASDADGTDDLAFEIRGNATGGSVDLTATLSSADTTFAIFANGTTAIGYNSLGTTYAPPNSAKLAVNGNITSSGAIHADSGFVGNADTATKWASAITIGMSGDVSSDAVNIDGSGNVTITNTVVANDSHTHDGRYYTETESDNRFVNVDGDTMTGKLTIGSGMATGSVILDFPGGAMYKMTDQGGFSFGGDSSVVIHAGDNVANYNTYFGIVAGTTAETLYLTADGDVTLVSNMQGGAAGDYTLTFGSDGVLTTPGNVTIGGDLTVSGGQITTTATSTRDKFRVWNSSTYTIGMDNSYTYGALDNDYAMTFQMNNDSGRGFWWGDASHTNAQGAMSLTTNGNLTVASSLYVGGGESVTSGAESGYSLVSQSHIKTFGSLVQEYNTSGGYISRPAGAQYVTSANNVTGAIKIKLPTHGTADMLSFWVDIYDYAGNESLSMMICGYLYQVTGGTEWINTEVITLANNTDKDFNVRFGADGSNNCVWIGEITSTWNYPQIIVRDFQAGFSSDIDTYRTSWAISFVTTFDSVQATQSSNFPVASTIKGLTSTVTELNYVDGVTSNVQTQINNRVTYTDLENVKRTGFETQTANNLAVGWYTIAKLDIGRGTARIGLYELTGGRHHQVICYVSNCYGESSTITVLQNTRFSAGMFDKLRIKDLSTYDGAVLQVYIKDATNAPRVHMLGDAIGGDEWDLVDWIPDATDPGGVSRSSLSTNGTTSAYSSFTVDYEIDLTGIVNGFSTTGNSRVDGQFTYQKSINNSLGNVLDHDSTNNYIKGGGGSNQLIVQGSRLDVQANSTTTRGFIATSDSALEVRTSTNVAVAKIKMSDAVSESYGQYGEIRWGASNAASNALGGAGAGYGSFLQFTDNSSASPMLTQVVGDLEVTRDLYVTDDIKHSIRVASGGNSGADTLEGRYYKFFFVGRDTVDNNWKKVCDVTLQGGALYRAIEMKITLSSTDGNYGAGTSTTTAIYFASFRRSGGTLDDLNDAILSGQNPTNHQLRIIKTATGVYELQILQMFDYKDAIIEIETLAGNGGTSNSITIASSVANGSTSGTVYTAATNANAKLLLASGELISGNVTGTLFADVIAANEIYADMIAANAITAQKIQANAVTANELQISSSASVANSIFFDGPGKRIDIKDASGVLRVRIGQL